MKSEQINSQINKGFSNTLLHGNCVELLSGMSSGSADSYSPTRRTWSIIHPAMGAPFPTTITTPGLNPLSGKSFACSVGIASA